MQYCHYKFFYYRMRSVFTFGRKILVLVLLLVMPLQGFAASLSHLLCSASSAIETTGSSYHHGGDSNEVTPHDHNDSDSGNSNDSHAGHLSCHQLSFALPDIAVTVFAGNLSVFVPTIFVLPSLFFPEQLQRPPLA